VSDRYYEDFHVGERFVSGGMTLTEAGIIEFACQWDPQPFHTDVEFARTWTFGGLIASGMHTMAVTLRLWLDQGIFRACSLGSPGIGEVQFPHPVRPGDSLRVVTDIVELRASASRRDRGIGRIHQPAWRGGDGAGDRGVPEAPAGAGRQLERGILIWSRPIKA
jgi:acyl dehydratase